MAKKINQETKAAVLAALLAGQGVNEIATQYRIDKATVSRWKKAIPGDQLQQIATKKAEDFGDLLAGYLRETLTTLKAQAIYFRNETWLSKQPAAEVAVLHGVQADKAVRLLEAIERANSEEQQVI